MTRTRVLRSEIDIDAFRQFVTVSEPRLRQALSASLGSQVGREATVDALSYAWENWARIQPMDNPIGYLYAVGRDRGRKSLRRNRPVFYPVDSARLPWVEPALPSALDGLPDRQREVVVLLHCYQWTMSEVADLLDISKSTVQNHAERGLASLRLSMGVEV
jgi:RNA polymerase sigma factor (sigma-70 family)